MAEPESGWFRGEGGHVWQMDLPLSDDLYTQYTKGYLVRVNEDGSPYDGGLPPGDDAEGEVAPQAVVPRPNPSAPKSAWVGYAVRTAGIRPDDAEAMTKQDLVDKYGKD